MSVPVNRRRVIVGKEQSNKQNEPVQEKRFKYTEGILLGLITLMVYGALFTYESNYLDFYGVHSIYINFDWAEVLRFASIIIIGFITIYSFSIIPLSYVGGFKSPSAKIQISIYIFIFGFLFATIFLYYLIDEFVTAKITLIITLVLLLLFLILPLFTKEKISYKQKLENSFLPKYKNQKKADNSIIGTVISKLGFNIVFITIIYFSSLLHFGLVGTATAYNKYKYPIIKKSPECAVVYTKSTSLICIEFDREKKEFTPGYRIYMNEDLKDIPIVLENIGPLKPKPTPKPTSIPTPIDTVLPAPTLSSTP